MTQVKGEGFSLDGLKAAAIRLNKRGMEATPIFTGILFTMAKQHKCPRMDEYINKM